MDKLVITVTVDSTMSFPNNPYCPETHEVEKVAQEYIDSVNAGASICHVHGVHDLETEVQADGRKLSKVNFEGWQELNDRITSEVDTIMQYGIASCRLEEKIKLMDQGPDLMSYAFNAHDEYFQPDPNYEANEIYAVHPRDELRRFVKACSDKGVKPEVETFHTGAIFNMKKLMEEGLFDKPVWHTLFFGWPGGTWTPPTMMSMVNFVEHLPEYSKFNVSCMDPEHAWEVLAMAIIKGGHVRVGWEDNPYLNSKNLTKDGIAKTNAALVEKIVNIAHELGREVATPEEAREIIGLE